MKMFGIIHNTKNVVYNRTTSKGNFHITCEYAFMFTSKYYSDYPLFTKNYDWYLSYHQMSFSKQLKNGNIYNSTFRYTELCRLLWKVLYLILQEGSAK